MYLIIQMYPVLLVAPKDFLSICVDPEIWCRGSWGGLCSSAVAAGDQAGTLRPCRQHQTPMGWTTGLWLAPQLMPHLILLNRKCSALQHRFQNYFYLIANKAHKPPLFYILSLKDTNDHVHVIILWFSLKSLSQKRCIEQLQWNSAVQRSFNTTKSLSTVRKSCAT